MRLKGFVSVDSDPAPLGLVPGSDAYAAILQGPTERLAAVEAQGNLAATTDAAQ